MQGPDPSLAYRPNLEKTEPKEKGDYRNFEVSSKALFQLMMLFLMLHSFMARETNFRADKHYSYHSYGSVIIMTILTICKVFTKAI